MAAVTRTKWELARAVYDACHLTGSFILRSGRYTEEYFDKYQVTADPAILDGVARAMAKLVPSDTEVLAGLELGAIPIATMMSHHSRLPTAFVRKTAKTYGTARIAEGTELAGRNVLVVEDIVTSGGQVVLSTKELRALGANVTHSLVMIDRMEGAAEHLMASGNHIDIAVQTLGLLRISVTWPVKFRPSTMSS